MNLKLIQNHYLSFIIICNILTLFSSEIISNSNFQSSLYSIDGNSQDNILPFHYFLFGDFYYAHSNIEHPMGERIYGTQIKNEKEISLNHAIANFEGKSQLFRFGLGFHTGTFVKANYEAEPQELKYIYQARGGILLLENLWLDVGIFPSHLGGESMVSMENFTYTRSLIADYSPYYEAGARLRYEPSDDFVFGIYILNGWQNIRETNKDKALGVEILYKFFKRWELGYNIFIGNEAPNTEKRQTRYYQDLFLKAKVLEWLDIYLSYDIGFQRRVPLSWVDLLESTPDIWLTRNSRITSERFARWEGFSLQFYIHLNEKWKLGGRWEGYLDREQIIVHTNTENGFQVYSGSLNLDFFPNSNSVFRLEFKHTQSLDAIFLQEEKDPAKREYVGILNFSFRV